MTLASPEAAPSLKRTMGFLALTLYGIGDMLGSGIYALMGKYAGQLGNAVWLGFLGAAVAALLTGLTYASIGGRYPKAGGAPYVTHRAFNFPMLSYILGLAVMASGLTSMGTATHGVARYMLDLLGLDVNSPWKYALFAAFLALVTLINFRGITASAWANAVCTCIEVGGLLLIIIVGIRYWGGVNYLETPRVPATGQPIPITPAFILSGAVLTFYSFVGFEDMLNVAEEVKNPRRNFPLALIVAVVFTTFIYMAVAITAISVVPHEKLAQSAAPMVDVMRIAAPWFPPIAFTIVSIFAIANTALLNYIMGSRLVYGMARQGMLPAVLGRVHPKRRTPHVAIAALLVVVSILVVVGDLKALASATSLLLLIVFVFVNASWLVLRNRPGETRGGFEVPWPLPIGGMLVSLSLIVMTLYGAFIGGEAERRSVLIAGGILAVITVLYFVLRPKQVLSE